jgi:alpha-1,6-mannosyltransferase
VGERRAVEPSGNAAVKILDVCEFYAPEGGGVLTYIRAKLAIGARMGHEIVIVAPGPRDEVEEAAGGGRIIFVKSPPLPFDGRYHMFWDAEPIHRILDAERPDVLEASSPWRGAWIARSWRGEAMRALFMHHDPLSAWAYRWFHRVAAPPRIDRLFEWLWSYLRRMCAGFEIVVCPSPSLAGRLRDQGIGGACSIPLGVERGVFSPVFRDAALRRDLLARCALPGDATLLLGVGRHTPEKRWPCITDAVSAVGATRPAGLVLVGDGHEQAKVLARIGGNPHLQTLAPTRDRALLARVMASADALVHGSASETFGLVVAEALASGLPIVTPNQGAAADLARPAFAETYAPGDARSAAAAIHRMLDRDPKSLRAATLAAAAGARTLDDHFLDLFDAYERRLRGAASSAASPRLLKAAGL